MSGRKSAHGARGTVALHPAEVIRALNVAIPADIDVFSDIGNTMAWALRYLQRDEPYRFHVNLAMGSMGHALPAAIGASLASRRPAVALVGDAGFMMTGFELHVAAENDVPVCVVVFNDRGHGMVEMGARFQWSTGVPSYRFTRAIDFAAFARAVGVPGRKVRDTEELSSVVASAMRAGKPALVDVPIDQSAVPPFGSRMDLLAKNFGGGEAAP